ncbi:hypothetical protein RUND412_009932 [Rhizina undulata]
MAPSSEVPSIAAAKMAAIRIEKEFKEIHSQESPAPLFRYDGKFKASVVEQISKAISQDANPERYLVNRADVYVVNLNGQKRLLKIVEPTNGKAQHYPPRDKWDMDLFRNEADAYASLMLHKVDEVGVIPRCFGMLEFVEPTEFTRSINLETSIENPPKGIILEYVKDAEKLEVLDLTKDAVDKVVEVLLKVHDAYVVHGDVCPWNILVTPGRDILIDFDHAATYPLRDVTPNSLQIEKYLCWELFNVCVVCSPSL